jgi:hypothetical protein
LPNYKYNFILKKYSVRALQSAFERSSPRVDDRIMQAAQTVKSRRRVALGQWMKKAFHTELYRIRR